MSTYFLLGSIIYLFVLSILVLNTNNINNLDKCTSHENIKNYTNHYITNIDNPILNKKIYQAMNGLYSPFNDIYNYLYDSTIKTNMLPLPYDGGISSVYKRYDEQIHKIEKKFLCVSYAIRLNTSNRYYECKNELKNIKSDLYKMRNALNKINKQLYNKFIKE